MKSFFKGTVKSFISNIQKTHLTLIFVVGHYGVELNDQGLPVSLGHLGLNEHDLVGTQTRELNKTLKVHKTFRARQPRAYRD